MNRHHSLTVTTVVVQLGTQLVQSLKKLAAHRLMLFALLAIVVSIGGVTARLTWDSTTPSAAVTIPPQALGYARPNVDPTFYQVDAKPFIPAQAQGYAHPVVEPAFYQDANATSAMTVPPQALGYVNRQPDPAFYQNADAQPSIPWQAQGYARPNVDPAFYQDAPSVAFIPPQAQGYVHSNPDPAFYQDATGEVTIPPQAVPYARPLVDPAFYQDTARGGSSAVAAIGIASALAVAVLGGLLLLARVRQRGNQATPKLARI